MERKINMVEINPIVGEEAFENALKNINEQFILVDFWAEWCGPCRLIHPVLDKMNQEPEMKAKLKILQVNIDEPENQALSMKYQIMSIPNLLFYGNDLDGKKYLVNRKLGAAPEPVFRDWIKREIENHEQKLAKGDGKSSQIAELPKSEAANTPSEVEEVA